jgi:CRP-like cAMP-binding protein
MAWLRETLSFDEQQRLLTRMAERVRVFGGMSMAEIEELLGNAEKCSYKSGSPIVNEGSTGNHFYLIISGDASVSKQGRDGPAELARLGPADSFGEMSLIDYAQRSATVSALSDCLLLRLTAVSLNGRPAIAAKLYRNIARILAARLREADEQLAWRL